MSRASRMLLVLAGLALIGNDRLLAQDWISDIKAVPQRHVNREVTVVGQVMAVTPNPPGTTRGTYTLVDDSDPAGIEVRTRDLPAPGLEFEVTGTAIQDPATATFLIDEISRTPAGRPGWLWPVIALVGLVVIGLLWMLVKALRQPAVAAAPPGGAVPPTVRPGPSPRAEAPTARPGPPPSARKKADDETEVVRPGSDATEVYRSLGVALKITGGPDAGKEFPIGKPTTLVGREGRRKNDITLSDKSISREQAKLVYNDQTKTFTLINESETNPTIVDGVTVDARELTDGATIEMGKTTATLERS